MNLCQVFVPVNSLFEAKIYFVITPNKHLTRWSIYATMKLIVSRFRQCIVATRQNETSFIRHGLKRITGHALIVELLTLLERYTARHRGT